MNEQKPLDNITKEKFDLYRKTARLTPLINVIGIIGLVGLGGGIIYSYMKTDINTMNKIAEIRMVELKNQPQYELQVQDLNGNGTPEKFYEINGKKFFLEIDGKNLAQKLQEGGK